MKKVYLAGAIDKVPPEFATTWRQSASKVLRQSGFTVYDPTEGKDLFAPGINQDVYTPKQIVETDLNCIDMCDIVLAEISRKDIPYHGTSMEIFYSFREGKVVYVWGGCQSYWIRYHSTQMFTTLEDALSHILYG